MLGDLCVLQLDVSSAVANCRVTFSAQLADDLRLIFVSLWFDSRQHVCFGLVLIVMKDLVNREQVQSCKRLKNDISFIYIDKIIYDKLLPYCTARS